MEIREFFVDTEKPYTVAAEPKGHYIEFWVYEYTGWDTDDDALFTGSIKWDGCSNWNFASGYNLHFCSQALAKQFGELLGNLYDLAAELLPEHAENMGSDKYK